MGWKGKTIRKPVLVTVRIKVVLVIWIQDLRVIDMIEVSYRKMGISDPKLIRRLLQAKTTPAMTLIIAVSLRGV
jgi:hypothetical protein